jgi:eukaryotic-like serine/threonine-protein kinase
MENDVFIHVPVSGQPGLTLFHNLLKDTLGMNNSNIAQSVPGMTLGRYHLLQRIGQGGMGEVWLGEDPRLHRQVAIKTLPLHNQGDREFLQRFEREARAAAALNYPHILSVHDYGQQALPNGQTITYIVMPYISGGSLEDRIAMWKKSHTYMPHDEAIAFLSQAAEAIDYAHAQGILHRDIKPANMLLRGGNWLMLADFGIARILSDQEQVTQTGMGFGTPEYMAPEQAQGKAEPASDNYSLAVIAYQLFTGQVPFSADSAYAITMQHILMPPPPPRQINPALPPAVEQVLLHGLAKVPEQRPPSARAFVAELQRALTSAPFAGTLIQAPLPPTGGAPLFSPAGRNSLPNGSLLSADGGKLTAAPAQKGITRRKVLIGGGVALVAIGVVGTWAVASRLAQAQSHLHTIATHTPIIRPTAQANAPTLTLLGHNKPITALSWSPRANILASAGQDDQVMLWDMQAIQQGQNNSPQPKAKQLLEAAGNILLAWSPDGKLLAIGNGALDHNTSDSFVLVYNGDLHAPAYNNVLAVPSSLNAFAWAPGKYLVAANNLDDPKNPFQFQLQLWDAAQPRQKLAPVRIAMGVSLSGYVTPNPMAFSPNGSLLAIGTDGTSKGTSKGVLVGQLHLSGSQVSWQPHSPVLTFEQIDFPPEADALTWSSDGQYVAAISNSITPEHQLVVWKWNNGAQVLSPVLPDANTQLTTLAWSPDSALLAVGNNKGVVYVWDIDIHAGNTLPVHILPGVNAAVQAVAWSMDGQWLAVGYDDVNDTIMVWKVARLSK